MASLSLLQAREIGRVHRWKFTPSWEVRKGKELRVTLPHTWNQDALSGKLDYFRGIGDYEVLLPVTNYMEGKRLYLRFKGANSVANVFVNGRHVTEHRGGYTAFAVDLTDVVAYGHKNGITVRVSNAPTLDVMPLLGDFNMYGGLYREVEFIILDPLHISLDDHGSKGVYVSQKTTRELAQLDTTVKLSADATVQLRLYDADKKLVAEARAEGKDKQAQLQLSVQQPRLWNGRRDPYLYTLETQVLDKQGRVTDTHSEQIGLRYFHVDAQKGFFLNGEHLPLRGVCRHQDWAGVANALQPHHHDKDMELMREMGVNAIRLAHYPHDKYVYELCDRYGMIVWAEIPFIGPGGYRAKGFVDQVSFRENGKQQLRELIRQNYNHPSICFWGIFNELKTQGDNPIPYLKQLQELAKKEDPSRLTVSASNMEGPINMVTDLCAWNKYYGWYGGDASDIGAWADHAHAQMPQRPIGISEYGAGGSVRHQQQQLKKPVADSYWHPENWQTHFHEEHWKAIDQRPFIWGSFVWNMFDFGAAHRREGEVKGINDKGLVTFDRQQKKDAFYFYKANWNKQDPFVYLANRRLTQYTQPDITIKAYSNCPVLELLVNGQSQGKCQPSYGTSLWPVKLQSGVNRIELRDASGQHRDAMELTLAP